MFSLTVTDLARLDFEQAGRNYTTQTRAADRLARLAFAARIVVLVLLGAALAAATTNLVFEGRPFRIATVAASALTLIAYTLVAGFQFDRRIHGHRVVAHRLWLVTERYRALIAELDEGMVDRTTLLRRRDDLIQQLHAIYDVGLNTDQAVAGQTVASQQSSVTSHESPVDNQTVDSPTSSVDSQDAA